MDKYPNWFTTDHESSMRLLKRRGDRWTRKSLIHYNTEIVNQLYSYGLIERLEGGGGYYRIKQTVQADCKISDFDKDKLTQSVTKLRELHNNIKLLSMRYSDCNYAYAAENTVKVALETAENFLREVNND